MAILETLAGEPSGLSFSEIVARLGIEKSTVSRILGTLERDGYVIRDVVTNVYRLGLKAVAIVLRYMDSIGFYDLCMPVLREVAEKTGELVQLAIVERDTVRYVAKVEGTQRIRLLSLLGREAVLHAASAGKVWLASLPEEMALKLVLKSGLSALTEKTICSLDRFREELTRVREHGYATVEEELILGVNAVGVPIRVARGKERVVGAIVLSGPAYRLPRGRLVEVAPLLAEAAERVAEVWAPDFSPRAAGDVEERKK